MANQSKYGFEIFTPNGTPLVDLTGIASLRRLSVARNRAGSSSFEINLNELERIGKKVNINPIHLLSVNLNEVKIRRGTRYLYGGQINYHESTFNDNQSLTVQSVGFLELLKDRFLDSDTIYTGTDAGLIGWDLIDTTQVQVNGDFGILQGAIQTSVDRDRTYKKDDNVKDLLINLSEVINGFDFEINYDKEYRVYYPEQGLNKPKLLFSYPGNIIDMKIPTDGGYMVNRTKLRGDGFGQAQVRAERNSVPYQAVYKVREKLYDESSVKDVETLNEKGDGQRAAFKKPIQIPQITLDGSKSPFLGEFWLGDKIKLQIDKKYTMYKNIPDVYYRIDAIDVDIDDNDKETIKLSLSLP